jgi:hypothetical protein
MAGMDLFQSMGRHLADEAAFSLHSTQILQIWAKSVLSYFLNTIIQGDFPNQLIGNIGL